MPRLYYSCPLAAKERAAIQANNEALAAAKFKAAADRVAAVLGQQAAFLEDCRGEAEFVPAVCKRCGRDFQARVTNGASGKRHKKYCGADCYRERIIEHRRRTGRLGRKDKRFAKRAR